MRVDHRKISVATTVETPKPSPEVRAAEVAVLEDAANKRRLYFEDVEVRRSRTKGVTCRVTLRKGDASYIGEAEGAETERSRAELAARAAVLAIGQSEGEARQLALDGCKLIDAFDREFVIVGLTARWGRESAFLSGTCEIKDSPETASVLAVLDATNRWIGHAR
jgi:hypothetical protein